MPHDLTLKAMNGIHRSLLALSRGRVGWTVAHMPALELTTTGRRTGQRRSVMLTSPIQEGSTLVVVASRGGDDESPLWFHNLVADPNVEVSFQGGPTVPMRARVATEQERERLWPMVTAAQKVYAGYQTKTSRVIPLVLLTPVP